MEKFMMILQEYFESGGIIMVAIVSLFIAGLVVFILIRKARGAKTTDFSTYTGDSAKILYARDRYLFSTTTRVYSPVSKKRD